MTITSRTWRACSAVRTGSALTAQAVDEMADAGLDHFLIVRRDLDVVSPALLRCRRVVVDVDADRRVPVVRLAAEANSRLREVHLEPGSPGTGRPEARQQLPEGAVRELQVDQNVVRGRDRDLLAGQRSAADDPRRHADGAHRLDTGDGTEQGRHRVESIDAVVDHRADARPVEGPRVAGVLAPGRRTRIGVVGDDQGRTPVSPGVDELLQPPDSPRRRDTGCAQEHDAAVGCRRDEPVGLRDGTGDRLLRVEVQPRVQDRLVDRRMARCRREVDHRIKPAGPEHRVEVIERGSVRRPSGDRLRPATRRVESHVHQRGDPDVAGHVGERRQVMPGGDIAAADDADPQPVCSHPPMVVSGGWRR